MNASRAPPCAAATGRKASSVRQLRRCRLRRRTRWRMDSCLPDLSNNMAARVFSFLKLTCSSASRKRTISSSSIALLVSACRPAGDARKPSRPRHIGGAAGKGAGGSPTVGSGEVWCFSRRTGGRQVEESDRCARDVGGGREGDGRRPPCCGTHRSTRRGGSRSMPSLVLHMKVRVARRPAPAKRRTWPLDKNLVSLRYRQAAGSCRICIPLCIAR